MSTDSHMDDVLTAFSKWNVGKGFEDARFGQAADGSVVMVTLRAQDCFSERGIPPLDDMVPGQRSLALTFRVGVDPSAVLDKAFADYMESVRMYGARSVQSVMAENAAL